MPFLFKRFKLFMYMHWVKFAIGGAAFLLLILAIWGLASLESFYRQLTLATLPLQLLMVAMNALIFVYFYMVVLQGGLSRVKKSTIKSANVNVHFSDVIGLDEAKEEAWEVVELIKDRTKLKNIGGKILRGIMFVGPPGCGKTLLAKAVATEAGIPFLSMSGSEFVEIFVGVGASKVRKLFKQARQLAEANGGCIIFIDELDAIGRKRVFSVFGGTEETNSTQNQLLSEMDGLKEKDQNVVVIGATNADIEQTIDSALLRPGRFDRKIYIGRPDLKGREDLFKFYLGKVKYDTAMDIGRLARKSVYKSPAEIESIVKEAALIAMRNKKDIVGYKEISEAMERIDLGIKHRKVMSKYEREMVAYHESGHLIALFILHPTDDVFKASIIARKESLGVVHHQPREELYTSNKDRILANIKVSLGGYVAEKLRFGVTSNGVAMDFQMAMHEAHSMVWKYGMGSSEIIGDYTVIPESQLSESVKEKLNAETQKIFQTCLKDVDELLKKERVLLDRFANELLTKEELEYDEIEAIFREYGKVHAQAPQTPS